MKIMKIKETLAKIFLLLLVCGFLFVLSSCNQSKIEESEIETQCKHSFAGWEVIEEPTCAKGQRKRICNLCQHMEKEYINPVEEHKYGEWKLVSEANCQRGNIKNATCEKCGQKSEIIEEEKGYHNYEDFTCSTCYQTASKGLEYTLSSDGKYYILTSVGSCKDSTVILVELYNKIPVTTIGENAFSNYTSIKEISFPETITTIDENAFSNCIGLTQITVPNTITKIGKAAFSGCDNLSSITLPFVGNESGGKENTHFGYIFGADSYSQNNKYIPKNLKEVSIDGTKTISDFAFYGCSNLTKIELSSTVETIGNNAFDDCDGLKTFAIPEKVKEISYFAFSNCNNLENITLSNNLQSISPYAFWKCNKLNIINFGSSIEKIGDCAFKDCVGLEKVTFSANSKLVEIGKFAFENCIKIKNITLPLGLNNIFKGTFKGCTMLSKVIIPESVTVIADYAFEKCTALDKVIIPSSTTIIGDFVFLDCTSLETIEISENSKLASDLLVDNIGIDIFKGCVKFEFIDFKNEKVEWESISKNCDWNLSCKKCVIRCVDGDIK